MEVSFSSIFSSVLSVSLLIGLLLLFLKKKLVVTRLGLGCMYFLLILILFRGFLPIDFYAVGLTTSIYSEHLLPWLRDFFLMELFLINGISITPVKLIIILWIIGSIFYACRLIKSASILKKKIESSEKLTDENILLVFQNALETVFNNQKPVFQLVLNDCFSSPALFGIRKPTILLPHLDYSEEELYLVFCHELLHYKHKDYIFNVLSNALCVIYWWNPLINLLFSSLTTQVQELWVDYHISKAGDKNQRINYMQTLATTLKQNQHSSIPKGADKQILLLTDERKNAFIGQRFDYIKTNSEVKSFTIYGIVVCLALFLSSYTIVFEPKYNPTTDEIGRPVYEDLNGETYFIRNGDKYDLYMENTYVGTLDEIPETFKHCPIYSTKEEVPQNEN